MSDKLTSENKTAIIVALIGSLSLGTIITTVISKCGEEKGKDATEQTSPPRKDTLVVIQPGNTPPTGSGLPGTTRSTVPTPKPPADKQEITPFSGQVFETYGHPAVGAKVTCMGKSTTTDEGGNFYLNLPFVPSQSNSIEQVDVSVTAKGHGTLNFGKRPTEKAVIILEQ